MNRKYMPLVIGGVLVLVVVLGLGYLLFSAKSNYADRRTNLEREQLKLRNLTNRNPFPADTNVVILSKQKAVFETYLGDLLGVLKQGQTPVGDLTRDRFRQLAEAKLRELTDEARKRNVVLPANFAFGFQRYAEGNLPPDDEMERLVDQFKSIAILCDVLFKAGISELEAVERTVFERDAQPAPVEESYGRRTRGREEAEVQAPKLDLQVDPLGLYTKEHYQFTYKAKDEAQWEVLNRLAKGMPFTVVTRVEITNLAKPVVTPPQTKPEQHAAAPVSTAGWAAPGSLQPPPKPEIEILPRDLRVTAGRDLPTIVLDVDMYRFLEPAADPAQGEEKS